MKVLFATDRSKDDQQARDLMASARWTAGTEIEQKAVATRARGFKPRSGAITKCVREGDAADQILAAANDFAADLIVVGSRGQTGLARFFAGSVARQVLLGAKCSVLIARGSAQVVRDRDRTDSLGVLALGAPWSAPTP